MDSYSLWQAVLKGQVRSVRKQIEAGADVRAVDNEGTPQILVLYSCWCAALTEKSRSACLTTLLAAGADANATDAQRRDTLLMLAAREGEAAAVTALLAAGADVHRKNRFGQTALDLATQKGNLQIQRMLEQAGCQRGKELTLTDVARSGDLERASEFLAGGVSAPERDQALRTAACNGQWPAFQVLVAAGADVHALDPHGYSLLHTAAQGGNPDMIRFLLQAGLDPNHATEDNYTPLMGAAGEGRVEAARLLIEAGADPLAETNRGQTALKIARVMGHAKKPLVALLRGPDDRGDDAVAHVRGLAKAADDPAFAREIDRLTNLLGRSPRPWPRRKGVFVFYPRRGAAPDSREAPDLETLQAQTRAAGFQLVRGNIGSGVSKLLLFPTQNKYAVVKACGTSGGNYDLDNDTIISWLRQMDQANPFLLSGCGFDWLSGQFLQPVQNATDLAQRMLQFCPDIAQDIVSPDSDKPRALAEYLTTAKEFGFWWD